MEDNTQAIVEEITKRKNPLLERMNKIPGTRIRLPSRGLFYTNGELDSDVVDGEVFIYPMTLTDDLIMSQPELLFHGSAVTDVIKRCLPQIKKPEQLLVYDVDYILVQMRKISYGTHIPIEYECPCVEDEEQKKKNKISGSNEYLIPVDHFIRNAKEIDPKTFMERFTVSVSITPDVTYNIRLRPIRFCDWLKIQQMTMDNLNIASSNDESKLRQYIAENYASITERIDDVTDSEFIKEFYTSLPRLCIEAIREKLDTMNDWGVEFKYTIKCNHCKKKIELSTQLNPIYFFTLPSSPETKKR